MCLSLFLLCCFSFFRFCYGIDLYIYMYLHGYYASIYLYGACIYIYKGVRKWVERDVVVYLSAMSLPPFKNRRGPLSPLARRLRLSNDRRGKPLYGKCPRNSDSMMFHAVCESINPSIYLSSFVISIITPKRSFKKRKKEEKWCVCYLSPIIICEKNCVWSTYLPAYSDLSTYTTNISTIYLLIYLLTAAGDDEWRLHLTFAWFLPSIDLHPLSLIGFSAAVAG